MKISILISVLILAVASVFAWKNHHQLVQLELEHQQVLEEAAALGVSLERDADGLLARNPLKREGKDREAEAKQLADEIIAFAKRMKEREGSGQAQDEDMQKETMQVMRRFLDMDASQLKFLIAELKASEEIDDDTRQGIIGFSIMMLANDSPETALAIFAESSEMMDQNGMGEHVVSSALAQLAEKDPFAALDWIRENGKKNPELVSERTKAAVIAGAARQDPAMAINLMKELDLKEQNRAFDGVARAADSPEKRMQLLETLRGLSAEDKDIKQNLLRSLGQQVVGGGYEASVKWLEQADMSQKELETFGQGLSYYTTKEETGKWMEWMASELPENELANRAGNIMRDWTRADYTAAGSWLNDAEEGKLKGEAVRAYAETVAPYEPEAAAQWALTLPEGSEREDVLRNIHKEWKKKDEAAAAVFAAEQGIE